MVREGVETDGDARPVGAWAPMGLLGTAGRTERLWAAFTGLVAALVAFRDHLPLLERSQLDSFADRAMGMAVSQGVDVSADVTRYYLLILVFLAAGLLALLVAAVLGRMAPALEEGRSGARAEYDDAAREYAYAGIFFAALSLLVGSWPWPALLTYALCTLHLGLSHLSARWRVPAPATTRGLLMSLVPLGVFAYVSHALYGSWVCVGTLLAVALALWLAAVAGVAYVRVCSRDATRFSSALAWAALPLLAAPVLNSIALELKNVLVVRGVVESPRPYVVYAGLTCLSAMVSSVVLVWRCRAGGDGRGRQELVVRAGHVLLLLLVVCSAYQPDVTTSYGQEYFESANHGLALDALLRYGELPLVENFDAHMLSKEVTGLLYYLLNPYEPWAFTLYDAIMCVPFAIIFNRLLACLVSERAALLWSLFSPVFALTASARPYIGALCYSIVSYLALLRALRCPGVGSYVLYCLSVVATCLLGLDVGVAAIVAGAVTFLVVWARSRDSVRLGRLFVVAAASIALCVALWVALCVSRGVDPVDRLWELVTAAASNANWATTPVGDTESLVTVLCYFVMPLCLVALLVRFAFFEDVRVAPGARCALWVAVVFFSVLTLGNLSRGIVRHTIAESGGGSLFGTVGIVVFCVGFYFCLKCDVGRTRAFGRFVGASALVCVAYGLAIQNGVSYLGGFLSDAQRAVREWSSPESYREVPVGGSRVTGSDEDDATLCQILDATLEPDETYLTLSSTDYLYAITGRRNPLYVNQSPLMLNGDTGQEYALEEIDEARPVYVLMARDEWATVDGLDVNFKYYRLLEYVYENYEPFVRIEGADYDLWCLSARRDELEASIDAAGEDFACEWEYVDDYAPSLGGELGLIPLLWAEDDEEDAWDTCEVVAGAEGAMPRRLSANSPVTVTLEGACGGRPAYVALDVEAEEDGVLLIGFGGSDAENPRALAIAIRAGRHRYLVRVSAYYEWWQGDVTQVSLNTLFDVTLNGLTVREGD